VASGQLGEYAVKGLQTASYNDFRENRNLNFFSSSEDFEDAAEILAQTDLANTHVQYALETRATVSGQPLCRFGIDGRTGTAYPPRVLKINNFTSRWHLLRSRQSSTAIGKTCQAPAAFPFARLDLPRQHLGFRFVGCINGMQVLHVYSEINDPQGFYHCLLPLMLALLAAPAIVF
jgi:hypothetical protein